MSTLTTTHPDTIDPHPKNVRRDAVPDQELVDSVKSEGILQPLGVVASGTKDRWLLIAGHRRLAAAKEAGLDQVPVVVLDRLDTEAKQISAMLVENLARRDLTPTEEAEGYHQLVLAGMDPKQISEATGRSHTTVVSRLKLASMVKPAREAVHNGQMTLTQAAELQKLDDRPDLRKEVLKEVKGHNFDWVLRRAVNQADTDAKNKAREDEFEAAGLPFVEVKTDQYGRLKWNEKKGPVRVGEDAQWSGSPFAKLKPDAWTREQHGRPVGILTKYTPPAPTAAEKKQAAEDKARKAEEKKTKADREAAASLRIEHVIDHTAIELPGQIVILARFYLTNHLTSYYHRDEIPALAQATGVTLPEIKNEDDVPAFEARINSLPPLSITRLLTAILTTDVDKKLGSARYLYGHDVDRAVGWLDWVEKTGYQLPQIDLDHRTELAADLAKRQERETASE